jgi:hypothetical protein
MDLRYPLKRPENIPERDFPYRQERQENAMKFLCGPPMLKNKENS